MTGKRRVKGTFSRKKKKTQAIYNMLSVYFHSSYPELKTQHVLNAHPANCICIEFDPKGRYFATGSADALVSIWDLDEFVCVRTLSRYVGIG